MSCRCTYMAPSNFARHGRLERARMPAIINRKAKRNCSARACQLLSSVRLLDPVHGGGHAEHAHEGAGGLLVAGGDGAPLLEPCPETFDPIAIAFDPGRAGEVGFVAL